MPKKVDEGFEMATSQNLPKVDFEAFFDFLVSNRKYFSTEMRGVKTLRSARASYGDPAIGNVQLKRQGKVCIVKALITPEHKIHQKAYSVTVVINEKDDIVQSAVCHDCVASAGGCKHAVAVLAWLHRRSEEPASTSVECYWRKSALSKVGSAIKGLTLKDVYPEYFQNKPSVSEENIGDFLSKVLEIGISKGCTGQIILSHKPVSPTYLMSLHHLSRTFVGNRSDCSQFLEHCKQEMDARFVVEAEKETRAQILSHLWYELKFGRIGGSLLYEAAKCSTPDGSLVDRIMGCRIPDTPDMKRGRELENAVLVVVERKLKCSVKKCGFQLSMEYPMIGVSADGMNETHTFEVKCPKKESTFKNYYDGGIKPKYKAQIQLQMLLNGKDRCYFCVARPDFEKTGGVLIVEDTLDSEFLKPLIESAVNFWKENIFKMIVS